MDAASTDEVTADGFGPFPARARWRRKRVLFPLALLMLMLCGALAAWIARDRLAHNFIENQLEAYGLPATYEIRQIGPRTEVLTNVVVGDPQAPDFTAERVEVRLQHRIGLPTIGAVIVDKPRLYGSYRKGVLSFGSLDAVIFRETGEPPALPAMDLDIRDGRGLVESDFGPIGLKVAGKGWLKGGFKGVLAATAPTLNLPGCTANRATLYGQITTRRKVPHFSGPLRLASLECPAQGLTMSGFSAALEAETDKTLTNPSGEARFDSGAVQYGANTAATVIGSVRAAMRERALTGHYTLAARGVRTPQALAAVLTAEGVVRAHDGFARYEIEGDVEGNALRPGAGLVAALEGLSHAGEGTLLAPIARQVATALLRESRGSAVEADVRLRSTGDGMIVLVPRAEMRGGSGSRLLAISRLEYSTGRAGATPRLAGNLVTGGVGIPQINGRMEWGDRGQAGFHLAMAPYRAGDARLAVPELRIEQAASGALSFVGRVEASGALPGGRAENLRLPVSGRWNTGGELTLWQDCTNIGFDHLALANLTLEKRELTLCPPTGGAILRSGQGGVRIAAGVPSLSLTGRLGDSPIALASGPVGFAWPGVAKVEQLAVALGPPGTASHFVISGLDARLGENIGGTFAGADVRLAAVPLDIGNAGGAWDYTAGKLSLTGAGFTLADRADPDRFEPLVARGAVLTLADNVVAGSAELRQPTSDRVVTTAHFRHRLATREGHADLDVDGLQFDDALQPDHLSRLALGVVANARGTVTGKGRLDWNQKGVTSSGTFGTDGLDFAAAFGPVKGASGTLVFTDLINLTTAPGQKLHVAAINPGVEVVDGEIEFELRNAQTLAIKGGRWPFMGGTLWLREFDFNFGVSEERRYIFDVEGLQAAQFVQQMDLENISTTGTFDGTVPIVFDKSGNGRIEQGVLVSRPPGGNLSYVGELTYKDLSPMANFAFNALRSLDFSQMRLIMEGPLTGEIVTRVRFDGVAQGKEAKSNFITRQLAKLPIQFRINIKAQFYQLMTSVKALYDPSAVRDPRELGLLSDDGKRLLRREVSGAEAEQRDAADSTEAPETHDDKPIQQ